MCDLNWGTYHAHLPWHDYSSYFLPASHVKRYLIDSVGLTQMFSGPYQFIGSSNSNHPSTLSTQSYNPSIGILSNPLAPADYDEWLQEHFDDPDNTQNSVQYLKSLDTLSKNSDIPFIDLIQGHMWCAPTISLESQATRKRICW